jgi:hypothetical protein
VPVFSKTVHLAIVALKEFLSRNFVIFAHLCILVSERLFEIGEIVLGLLITATNFIFMVGLSPFPVVGVIGLTRTM